MSNLTESLRNSVADIKTNYGTGREMILDALKSCFSLYCDILNEPNYYAPLRKLYVERGFKVTKQTDAATKLIRLTIVEASKKANPYAQVFRIARKAKVTPDKFLDWLEQHGGIERVRLSKNPIKDDTAKSHISRTWLEIQDAAREYVTTLQPKAKVTFADGKGIAFKGSVAMLVVTRSLDTDEVSAEPLSVVEVIDADMPRLKSLLQHYSEKATS